MAEWQHYGWQNHKETAQSGRWRRKITASRAKNAKYNQENAAVAAPKICSKTALNDTHKSPENTCQYLIETFGAKA